MKYRKAKSIAVFGMVLTAVFIGVVVAPMPSAEGTVTAGSTAPLVTMGQCLRDDSSAVPLWGIGATGDPAVDSLVMLDVHFDDAGGMDTWELKPLDSDSALSGVGLYRDNGMNDDVLDPADTPITLSNIFWAGDHVTMTLNPGNEPVPASFPGSYYWFVVIRTDVDIDNTDWLRSYIQADGIMFSGGESQPAEGVSTQWMDVVKTSVTDISEGGIGIASEQAVLGIQIADGGSFDTIDAISVEFEDHGGFAQSDLLALSNDCASSGVALYRDDGSVDDVWDPEDLGITLDAISGNIPGTITMDLPAVEVPDAPTGDCEFFIVVRTSDTITNGDAFRVKVDVGFIVLDGVLAPNNPNDRDMTAPEAGYDDGATLIADTLPPSIDSGSWNENSPYLWVDTEGVLWFSDLMPSPVAAEISGTASDDVFGSGLSRMNFSAEDTFALFPQEDLTPATWSGEYYVDTTTIDANSPVTLTLYDNAGNYIAANYSYREDTTAPVVEFISPVGYEVLSSIVRIVATAEDTLTGVDPTTVLISFDYWVTSYSMVYNGTAFVYDWNTALHPDGEYRISIKAQDMVSNLGLAIKDVVIDNTGPTVSIHSPTYGQYVGGVTRVYAIASDPIGVESMMVQIDSGTWHPMSYDLSVDMWFWDWDTTGLNGTHRITVYGIDAGNNVGSSVSVEVIIDNEPPAVTPMSPLSGDVVRGSVPILVEAHDLQSLETVYIMIEGFPWVEAGYNATTGYYEWLWNTPSYIEKSYTLSIKAQDTAGNSDLQTVSNIIVDNTAPALTINFPVQGEYIKSEVYINATVTDANPYITQYNIDGGAWSSISVPWNSSSYTDGAHSLTVMAEDRAGSTCTKTIELYVDNTAPTCALAEPLEGQYLQGEFTFKVIANDEVGIAEVILTIDTTDYPMTFNALTNYYEYTMDLSTLAHGTHLVRAAVTDFCGHTTTTPQITFNNIFIDADADGVPDTSDEDIDDDHIPNIMDVFPYNAAEWSDMDGDGTGDNADLDLDGDSVPNAIDAYPSNPLEWSDTDNDSIGDNADADIDGDGVPNDLDAFPYDPAEWLDTDGDGIGNNKDKDDDNDGIEDGADYAPLNSRIWRKEFDWNIVYSAVLILALIMSIYLLFIRKRTLFPPLKKKKAVRKAEVEREAARAIAKPKTPEELMRPSAPPTAPAPPLEELEEEVPIEIPEEPTTPTPPQREAERSWVDLKEDEKRAL